MFKGVIIISLGILALGLAVYLAVSRLPASAPRGVIESDKFPYEPAPDLILKDFGGAETALKDFRGKAIFIDFWAAWCVFCKAEIKEIEKIWQENKTAGDLAVFGIHRTDTESKETGFAFIKELGATYPLFQDNDGKAYRLFSKGVQAMPLAIFINKNGFVQKTIFGPKTAEQIRNVIKELANESAASKPEPIENRKNIMITDGKKHTIPLEEIVSGGPPKDGIPSVDKPVFVSTNEADKFLEDNKLGLGIEYKGAKRFYPYQILVWHEIVNDVIAGDPILITYCPLCGTGIAFSRVVNGETLEFGTSGKLYNSNLLMYDRKYDNLWSQVLGEAVVGELSGTKLEIINATNILWKDWKQANSGGKILSDKTGFLRNYKSDPYEGYYTNESVYFPLAVKDNKLHSKTLVVGIILNNQTKAYPSETIKQKRAVEDEIGGVKIKIEFNQNTKEISVYNATSKEIIPKIEAFWFSWVNAHPKTLLYK